MRVKQSYVMIHRGEGTIWIKIDWGRAAKEARTSLPFLVDIEGIKEAVERQLRGE